MKVSRKRADDKKAIVITGASSGIGRAAALCLARRGHDLVLASRGQEALAQVAEACRREGAAVLTVVTDTSDAAAVSDLAVAAIAHFGRVDVWVNDAGVGAVGPFEDTPTAAHEQVIRTDLLGYMYGAHAIIPHFKARGHGTIINLLSLASWTPSPYAAAYSAAKFGLRGFTNALRGELGRYRHIHVCDVHPSFVDTPGMQHGANYIGRQLKPPPGVLPVQAVADAIVELVQRPRRQIVVGRGATALARTAFTAAPAATMWSMARLLEAYFKVGQAAPVSDGNLFGPSSNLGVSGEWRRPALRMGASLAGVAFLGAAGALIWRTNTGGARAHRR